MITGKITALTRWTFVSKVIFLLFNMLSRFVIAFLPSSKHLLISWIDRISLKAPLGTFLVVQWLGLNAFTAVAQVQSLFRVPLDRALSIYIVIDISLGWLISYLFPYIRGIHRFCNAVIKKKIEPSLISQTPPGSPTIWPPFPAFWGAVRAIAVAGRIFSLQRVGSSFLICD